MKTVNSLEKVIKLCGGIDALAEMCSCGRQNVFNFRIRGYIPPAYYPIIEDHLNAQGFSAARALFRFKKPSKRKPREATEPAQGTEAARG
jgi:hypothetical protein